MYLTRMTVMTLYVSGILLGVGIYGIVHSFFGPALCGG
jgi:hypothetical protein